MGHSFDMLTFDFLLKPPQPFTGLFLEFFRESLSNCANSELLSREVTDKKFGLLSCQSVPLR